MRTRGGGFALLVGIDRYPLFDESRQLESCVRDARLMAEVLRDRFGFPEDGVELLLDEAATREGILSGLAGLRRRARPGDSLVFYYSGHGSRVRDREGDEPDGWDETIVPYDGGRSPHPFRDITDDELHAWVLETVAVTPYVTVIADTCYSGTILRIGHERPEGEARQEKWVPPDERPLVELPPSPVPTAVGTHGLRDAGSSFVPASERYVLLAACRAGESAGVRPAAPGAPPVSIFTFHLCRELRRAPASATYSDLLPPLRAAVAAETREQTPQLEGARGRLLFGGPAPGPEPASFASRPGAGERLACLRSLLAHADGPGNPLRGCLEAQLLRRGPDGAFRPAGPETGESPGYHDGERLALRVLQRSGAPLHVHVFDLGLSGMISLLFPVAGADEPLAPEHELLIGVRPGDEIVVRAQPASGGLLEGREQLLIIATTQETDLAWVTSDTATQYEAPPDAAGHWTAVALDFWVRGRS